MGIYALHGISPKLPSAERHWLAPDANLIGNVILGEDVSVWFGAVLRGDNEPITVGRGSNIQEACILHTDMGFPLIIGENCTIGHRAMLHGCRIGDNSLVGMGATILNGAEIGDHSVVGACALVTENKRFPPYSLLLGAPARIVRELNEGEIQEYSQPAEHYRENIARYRKGLTASKSDHA
ncbi:MAG: gamma carbonic anhydrase family protein [Rhodobacteraceae bacterium]|nr:gamma carbonic anhydrase family protein [Paracoccaceae bacterium]